MTREEIEQLYVEEPNCFETDREEQWYKVGLKEGLATADSHPNWIPVEEELPKKDGKYLFYDKVLGHEVSIYYDGVTLVPSITHWMPMPHPPRKEAKNDTSVFD